MSDLENLQKLFMNTPKPACAALLPFSFIEADSESGVVKVEFEPQPAFGNMFGNIQGGFAVAMLDIPISFAAFLKLQQWLPTIEIKSSFLSPAKLGKCIGEGRIIRAGKSIVFVEGKLWGADGKLAVHATATLLAT
nr:PaaI family thioesterase [Pseudomonas benzenivorans]